MRVHLFHVALGIVIDHNLQRVQHGHHAGRALVQILADEVLQHRQFDDSVGARDSGRGDEIANRLRGIAAASQARKRGHAGIVPAAHCALFD